MYQSQIGLSRQLDWTTRMPFTPSHSVAALHISQIGIKTFLPVVCWKHVPDFEYSRSSKAGIGPNLAGVVLPRSTVLIGDTLLFSEVR